MKQILFIVNPISGGKKKEEFISSIPRIIGDKAVCSIAYTKGPGDATEIAHNCHETIVVAVGGDGTVNEVAKGIIGTDKVLGIIPFGSGNGLARHLGISMNTKKALMTIVEGSYSTIDSAEINGIPFCCTCGIGMDAAVGMEFSKHKTRGLMTYIRSSITIWRHYSPERYTITIDGKTIESNASIITIGNANQWGNNSFITPKASVQDGLLDIAVIEPFRLYQVPLLALRLFTKTLTGSAIAHYYRGTDITILRDKAGEAHFDGEPLLLGDNLEIKINPKSLHVIVPVVLLPAPTSMITG